MDHHVPAFVAEPPETPEVTAAYQSDIAANGYVDNLTRVWCWRPDVATSFTGVRSELLDASTLTERDVAVLVVASAAARGDSYCSLAWGRRLAGLADEKTAVDVLQGRDAAGLSDRERALARWAGQVVRDPNATTRADVDRLREAGLTDREIVEATTHIALRLAFSTVNDALGAVPDPQLVAKTPQAVRDAVTYGRAPGPDAA
jgi:uncharacterized peroxidase-related enzyme